MVEFGKRLRALRKEKKLTQKQLGKMIGVQDSVISFYELGDRMPSPEIIVRLATVLHVSADYLMGLDKHNVVDLSGLDNTDIELVRNLADTLRMKNEEKK